MMSNTYHYSLYIILLIFGDLKGCVRTRIITKSLAHIVTLCAKDLSAYRVDTVPLPCSVMNKMCLNQLLQFASHKCLTRQRLYL